MSKRQNYTTAEKELLIRLVHQYKHIVESKGNTAYSIKEKEAAWQQIADHFNTKGLNIYRDAYSLRRLWSNYKQECRKKPAGALKNLYETVSGGGPSEDGDSTGLDEIERKDFIVSEVDEPYTDDLSNPTTIIEHTTPIEPPSSKNWVGKKSKPSNLSELEKIKIEFIKLQMELCKRDDERKQILFEIEKQKAEDEMIFKRKLYEKQLNV